MTAEQLKALTLEGFQRMFNRGDLDFVEEAIAPNAVDHQEAPGTDFAAHLKNVIAILRNAFPDLRFEVHEMLCEGQVVACRSMMTGTHQAPLKIGPLAGLPVTGARVEVPHMHFFRYDEQARLTDLWHVWNTLLLARQLGAPAPDLRVSAPA
ncbi:MAG: ester cyclase [Solirubrobacteraceae bacterium]